MVVLIKETEESGRQSNPPPLRPALFTREESTISRLPVCKEIPPVDERQLLDDTVVRVR